MERIGVSVRVSSGSRRSPRQGRLHHRIGIQFASYLIPPPTRIQPSHLSTGEAENLVYPYPVGQPPRQAGQECLRSSRGGYGVFDSGLLVHTGVVVYDFGTRLSSSRRDTIQACNTQSYCNRPVLAACSVLHRFLRNSHCQSTPRSTPKAAECPDLRR